MKKTTTNIDGCFLFEYEKNCDVRGSFSRLLCRNDMREAGINIDIEQSSLALNKSRGTMRGMHFQGYPSPETKLVTCTSGSALYVVVDLRGESNTFKNIAYTTMSAEDSNTVSLLYIPKYCASGYQTLEDNTGILYYMDEFFDGTLQAGVNCFSNKLNIEWDMSIEPIMSGRDKGLGEPWG